MRNNLIKRPKKTHRVKWKNLSLSELIEKANEAHKNDLDHYSYGFVNINLIETVNSKIEITCNVCKENFYQTIEYHINYGRGCDKCARRQNSKNKSLKIESILDRLRNLNCLKKCSIELVEVLTQNEIVNNSTEVPIICNNHNPPYVFNRSLSSLFNNYGCFICMKSSKEINSFFFKERAKLKLKDAYEKTISYHLIEDKHFINNGIMSNIPFYCKIHEYVFYASANSHLNCGTGCDKCGYESSANKRKVKIKDIIDRVNKHPNHKNKNYGFELLIAKGDENIHNNYDEIEIICNNHLKPFVFKITISALINAGHGCQRCAGNLPLTLESFFIKANEKHLDKFDYSLVNEIDNNSTVISIICNNHKTPFIFKQVIAYHLSGDGCPKCVNRISKPETKWLDSLNIKEGNRQVSLPGLSKLIKIDGYDPETNTAYEFHGDYWHCNPNNIIYSDPNKLHPKIKHTSGPCKGQKMTYGEVYQRTINKENLIIAAGYNLVVMWESDFIKMNKVLKNNV